jgi:hypothetical protein
MLAHAAQAHLQDIGAGGGGKMLSEGILQGPYAGAGKAGQLLYGDVFVCMTIKPVDGTFQVTRQG